MWNRPAAGAVAPGHAHGYGRFPEGASQASDNGYDYHPAQVIQIRQTLLEMTRLPPELVDIILDTADVWGCTFARNDFLDRPRGYKSVPGGDPLAENAFCLRTLPIGLDLWTPADSQGSWWALDASEPHCSPCRNGEYSLGDLADLASFHLSAAPCPVKMIKFYISSKDQGMGGYRQSHGTFSNSWTWFSAGVERFCRISIQDSPSLTASNVSNAKKTPLPSTDLRGVEPPLDSEVGGTMPRGYFHRLHPSQENCIQKNRLATPEFQRYTITWRADDLTSPFMDEADLLEQQGRGRETATGKFVQSLQYGDVVTVWAHARFPFWDNRVQIVGAKVYFRV